jgi:hypothetical protein
VNNRNLGLVIGLVALVIAIRALNRDRQSPSPDEVPAAPAIDRTAQRIDEELAPPRRCLRARDRRSHPDRRPEAWLKGPGRDRREVRKIEIARQGHGPRRSVRAHAEEHKEEPVQLGLEFSRRRGEDDCCAVVPMGTPDRTQAALAVATLQADGGTPIGQAMIKAKRARRDRPQPPAPPRRHRRRKHGWVPTRQSGGRHRPETEAERPAIYFVAFDVDEKLFNGVRDAGGLVLPAANAKELNDTLDTLLRGRSS